MSIVKKYYNTYSSTDKGHKSPTSFSKALRNIIMQRLRQNDEQHHQHSQQSVSSEQPTKQVEVGTNGGTEVAFNSTDGFVPQFDREDKVAEAFAALEAKLRKTTKMR